MRFPTDRPFLIAHRGCTRLAPENSLASFQCAGRLGYPAIETDVHLLRDGSLVCCHDSSLQRTFDSPLVLEEATWDDLSGLRMSCEKFPGLWPDELLRLPTFAEYLDICAAYSAIPFLESKGPVSVVDAVVAELQRRDLQERVVFSSCIFEHLLRARELEPNLFLHHIFSTPEQMGTLAKLGNAGLSYNYPNPDDAPRELLQLTHSRGVKICLRAADSLATFHKMQALQLDYFPTNCLLPGAVN
ncbi:MAG: hypothetical protein IJJ26_06840 [Victivallales bacterium]|nr:hypothetical protein [Victivallales bacterium]